VELRGLIKSIWIDAMKLTVLNLVNGRLEAGPFCLDSLIPLFLPLLEARLVICSVNL